MPERDAAAVEVEGILRVPRTATVASPGMDEAAVPPPPYQLRNCSFLMAGAEFDRALAQSTLPAGLKLAEAATGGFYLYEAPEGWAVAPFTALAMWVDVEGFDSEDGSKGRWAYGFWSGKAEQGFRRWLARDVRGSARIHFDESRPSGVGRDVGNTTQLAMELLRNGAAKVPVAGNHYYVWEQPGGDLVRNAVGYFIDYEPAEPVSLEITAPPGSVLDRLRPRRLTWAGVVTGGIMTMGLPAPVPRSPDKGPDAAAMVHLTLLSQMGRGAVVVDPAGAILFANAAAIEIGGAGFTLADGKFRCTAIADQARLRDAIAVAAAGQNPVLGPQPLAISRGPDRRPILVQPVRIGPESSGPYGAQPGSPSVLLLITDPDRGVEHDAARALELIGLAPAEARIAALVGAGLAPKDVARRVGNTEGTVRFALSQVYRKLGVARQSELARIVARLEALGV